MKFSLITSLFVAAMGATSAAALCCTECGGVLQKCMDECQADGTSSTVCGKVCYGQGVRFLLLYLFMRTLD